MRGIIQNSFLIIWYAQQCSHVLSFATHALSDVTMDMNPTHGIYVYIYIQKKWSILFLSNPGSFLCREFVVCFLVCSCKEPHQMIMPPWVIESIMVPLYRFRHGSHMIPPPTGQLDATRTTSLSELDLSYCGLEDPHAQRLAKALACGRIEVPCVRYWGRSYHPFPLVLAAQRFCEFPVLLIF